MAAQTTGLAGRLITRSATPTARTTYVVNPARKTPVPTGRELHVMNRLGCGFTPTTLKQMRALGGWSAWLDRQLNPGSVPESTLGLAVPTWFPDLAQSPAQKWASDQAGTKMAWEYARDLSNYSLLRRVYSQRTVLETMVELWSHHLHVDANHNRASTQRAAYDAVIRQHALGRFDNLLVATTLHPAMLLYLDNWRSVKGNPNENHGRELLELHTVGTAAGYTEAMVKDSAKILSGYTVVADVWTGTYDSTKHTTGPVTVLGFSHPNGAADGRQLTIDYLRYLARHPATARRIARKLCIRFVSDSPSDAYVQRIANAYLAADTDIKATLKAIVNSDEFWASAGQKVRTPVDDVVATCRVLGVKVGAPASLNSFAHAASWMLGSALVYQWARPDGAPDRAAAWSSPTRMLNSWRFHWNLAGGWWPTERVTYRRPRGYLPKKKIRFDKFVDHLSRKVLGRPSTPQLLRACCEGIDVRPGEVITAKHAVMSWKFPRLLGVLLDSPAHMSR